MIRKKDKFVNVYCYYYDIHRLKQSNTMQRFLNKYKDTYLKNN